MFVLCAYLRFIVLQRWLKELPKPPVVPLETTLERYIESLEAFVPNAQLSNTRKIVEEFRANEGPALQKLLEKFAQEKENWVSRTSSNSTPSQYLRNREQSASLQRLVVHIVTH